MQNENKNKELEKIIDVIKKTDDKEAEKINWTNAWSNKYPVLASYQKEVDIPHYANEIRRLLEQLEMTYHYSKLDAMLVLKDILYHEWKDKK